MMAVRDNTDASRFEIDIDGQIAHLDYQRNGNELSIVHTEVPSALRRRGLGTLLAKSAIDAARAQGLRLKLLCPFVRDYRRKHPEA